MEAELKEIIYYFEEHDEIIFWSSLLSIFTFIGTIITIPWLITKIPADYFIREEKITISDSFNNPILKLISKIFRNILGYIFILIGFIMLFIPGQGLITMVIGLMLIDFPHKRKIEHKIIQYPKIKKAINSIREKAGKPNIKV